MSLLHRDAVTDKMSKTNFLNEQSNFLKAWVHGESLTNMFLLKFILFICLLWALVTASEILDLYWGMQDFFVFTCSRWDLVHWPGIKPETSALGTQSLSYWTPGKSRTNIFYSLFFPLILDLQLWIIFSQFLFFFFFASIEHMVMNIYITISWQLFQMRYFPCLAIYTNIQASSWGRFYDLLFKYTTITLVILLVRHTCPPLGWLPMLIDIQTTQNFCSIGFSMKNTTAWWTVLKCHGTTSMKLWATINTSIKPPAIMCWGDAEKLACFWECWQWQSVGNNSINGPSWESWVLGTGISEL